MTVVSDTRIHYLSLIREVEDFLYEEMEILDARRFKDWLTLFSDDIRYWMPMRKNMSFREQDQDITSSSDVAWIDDDKASLTKRINQILTGIHWAEEPLSRVSHLISNIRIARDVFEVSEGAEIEVRSNFLLHRNRLETETDLIAGRRIDLLRRMENQFVISQRTILIDHSVLTAKNLTFFF